MAEALRLRLRQGACPNENFRVWGTLDKFGMEESLVDVYSYQALRLTDGKNNARLAGCFLPYVFDL